MDFLTMMARLSLRYILQLVFEESVYAFKLKRRTHFIRRVVLSLLLIFGFALAMMPFFVKIGLDSMDAFFPYVILYLISWMISICGLYFCFEIKFTKALFIGISSYAIQHMIYEAVSVAGSFFLPLDGIARELVYNILPYVLVSALLYFTILKPNFEIGAVRDNDSRFIVLAVILVIATTILNFFVTCGRGIFSGQVNELSNILSIVSRIYGLVLCALVWLFSLDIFKEGRFQRERQILELMFNEKIKQYEQSEQSIEMVNMKYHDLKRMMRRLEQTEDAEGMRKLYNELNDAINAYDYVVRTGNNSLDVVVSDKALLCEKKHIKFSFLLDGTLLSFMDTIDIYSLFDNALDNAIESVSQIEAEECRIISLQVIRHGRQVFIHCENRCKDEPEFVNGLPQTTKKEHVENHGYGVKSIRYVVENYGGELVFSLKDHMFCLDIMFPEK